MKPALKRRLVDGLDQAYRVGVRRACVLLEFSRSSYYYRSIKVDALTLRQRLREIAQVRIRYGYQRFTCFCGVRAGGQS
jgi:putative transposase